MRRQFNTNSGCVSVIKVGAYLVTTVPRSEKETIQMYFDNLVIAYASVINSTTLVEKTGWKKL